jgi:hypothetical protein
MALTRRGVRRLLGRMAKKVGIQRVERRGPTSPLPAVPVDPDVTGLRLTAIDPRPYEGAPVLARAEMPLDEAALHRYERLGQRYYHPVGQTQFALRALDGHAQNGDPAYLELAATNARDVVARYVGDGYLPYGFDFPLHGDAANTIHAEWFSGMAQGQFLSLAARLAERTGDAFWRTEADRVYRTLADVHGPVPPAEPWVTFVDHEGMLWFEEYAGDVAPMRVLNGHIFAMFGVYDYWLLTGRDDVRELFARAASTVLEAVPRLRVPGEASWYGLRVQDNPRAQSDKYHVIHVSQLVWLARMTGDERFARLAAELESDVPVAQLPLPVRSLL